MMKHTVAINILKEELDNVAQNVRYLQTCLGKSKLRAALFPNREAVILSADLRWRRLMKEQLAKAEAIEKAIKVLERDI